MERQYRIASRDWLGKPKVITMVEIPPELRPKLPYRVMAYLPYEAQPNGLPTGSELTRVTKIEEQLIAALTKIGAEHLGHITFDSTFTIAFQSSTLPPETISVKTGLFKKTSLQLTSASDPNWTWFEEELQLDSNEIEQSLNHQLLHTLAKEGDNASTPRPVDFAAFFPDQHTRAEFVTRVKGQGYELSSQGCWEAEGHENPFGCELVLVTPIEAETIASRCGYLRKVADECGGEFDGWASPVMK